MSVGRFAERWGKRNGLGWEGGIWKRGLRIERWLEVGIEVYGFKGIIG